MDSPISIQPPSGGGKRPYPSDDPPPSLHPSQPNPSATSPLSTAAANSIFRNVSACDRCRKRKNRCDQQLPACAACSKVGVRCVSVDAITKQELPRSYIYYLESRVEYFESLLNANNIPFEPPDAYGVDSKPVDHGIVRAPDESRRSLADGSRNTEFASDKPKDAAWEKKKEDTKKLNQLVSNIGMVSVQGASDPQYLGSLTFAKVVFAAVKSSVSTQNSERNGVRPSRPLANVASSGSTMFGLQTKPATEHAPFPDRQLGKKLVTLYFEHANPQIPILHRSDFMELFDRAYSSETRTPRDSYFLNIVFAIGAGIIFGSSSPQHPETGAEPTSPTTKRAKLSNQQHPPEEYHAAAIVHLESFLGSNSATDRPDGFGGGLEELQAVLLLAGFALLQPVAPGLWYIVGIAVRLAIDLGLHFEEGTGIGTSEQTPPDTSGDVAMEAASAETLQTTRSVDAREKGRREWVRDLRRRLWWCVYSFDRLVSTCVGRPFGITDQVVTTEFPSLLDDQYISRSGFSKPADPQSPSYKHVAYHYFRLRLLQSEILQVLQYQQAQIARQGGTNSGNGFMHTKLPSPFLASFGSFRSWRKSVDERLWVWKECAPSPLETGVQFSVQFLELNYWQAVIMLYRQSLTIPGPLAAMSPKAEASSPSMAGIEEQEDEDDVFLKVAEAGQKVLKLYRQLHRVRLVNYTYLATHHLFIAGISFLYAVWHSPLVRSRLTLDDVDFTILAATSVLGDLTEKCPPAEACRDAFERMSKATVQMCMSTTGFGFEHDSGRQPTKSNPPPRQNSFTTAGGEATYPTPSENQYQSQQQQSPIKARRPPPKFDMNLRDLFPDDIKHDSLASQSFSRQLQSQFYPQRRSQQAPPPPQRPSGRYSFPPQQQSLNNQINAGLGLNASHTPSGNIPLYASQQQQQVQQVQDNLLATSPLHATNLYGMDLLNMPGLDFLQSSGYSQDLDTTGIDLGLGPGMDFQHDWSDGTGVDIFDGFFFGNAVG